MLFANLPNLIQESCLEFLSLLELSPLKNQVIDYKNRLLDGKHDNSFEENTQGLIGNKERTPNLI